MSGGDSAPELARVVLGGLFDGSPDLEGEFRSVWPGVDFMFLYGFNDRGEPLSQEGPAAALIRYAPGTSVPVHLHRGVEHIIVLAGAQADELAVYPRGSLVINPPGTRHRVVSEQGCLVLAIWTKPVEVLED